MKGVLLDTHVLVWALGDDRRLGAAARQRIESATSVLVSTASAWELAVKCAAGKLPDPRPLLTAATQAGVEWLAVDVETAAATLDEPRLSHRDPFDQLIATHAHVRGATLITADRRVLATIPEAVDARH